MLIKRKDRNLNSGLKAYAVLEKGENTGGIVFAKKAIVARRRGASEYSDGDFSGVSCRRVPWADQYVGRTVPAHVMIMHGWHFECSGCAERIDEYHLEYKRLPLNGVIGSQNSHVFCCTKCARKYYSIMRRRKAEEQRAIEALKEIVRKRFPDADFCDHNEENRYGERHHAYVINSTGGWHWQQVKVAFRFPGMKHGPAKYHMDCSSRIGPPNAYFTCCNGDIQAFEEYASSTKASLSKSTA